MERRGKVPPPDDLWAAVLERIPDARWTDFLTALHRLHYYTSLHVGVTTSTTQWRSSEATGSPFADRRALSLIGRRCGGRSSATASRRDEFEVPSAWDLMDQPTNSSVAMPLALVGSLPIRLSPTATSGSVRPCSWTFTSVAIFGSQSLPEFQRLFPDDAACAAYLEKARWSDGFVCPHCQPRSICQSSISSSQT